MFGIATAPPAPVYYPAPKPSRIPGPLRAVWALLKLTAAAVKAAWWVLTNLLLAVVTLARWNRSHVQRHALWGAELVALGAVPLPWSAPLWVTVAAWAGAVRGSRRWRDSRSEGGKVRRRFLSDRETVLLSATAAGIAAWHLLPPAPGYYGWGMYVVAGGPLVTWCRWRWVRPEPPDPFIDLWHRGIAGRVPELAGRFTDADPDAGVYTILLDEALAADAARLDAVAESAAHAYTGDHFPRGSINLTDPPGMPSPSYLRVVLSNDPEQSVSRVRFWDGPTLDQDGSYVVGYTRDGGEVRARLWRLGGGANLIATGAPGSGKGGLMRGHLLEAALSPDVFVVAADAKAPDDDDARGGAGIPEVRAGMDVYAVEPEEWEALVWMTRDILGARSARYGDAGRSKWYPNAPVDGYCDPLWLLAMDELHNLARRYPKLEKPVGEISALGRSFGLSVAATTQQGVGGDFWTTKIRGNLRGNGIAFIGQPGDVVAEQAATQDWKVPIKLLPKAPGWEFVLNKIDQGVPMQPVRIRYPVSEVERDFEGMPAEFGVAEEWAARKVDAKLHPQDQDIVDKWLAEFNRKTVTGEVLEQHDEQPRGREVIEVAPGVHVGAPRRLAAVPSQPARGRTARELLREVTRPGVPMARKDIHAAILAHPDWGGGSLAPTYLSTLIADAAKERWLVQTEHGWERVA